MLPSQTVYIPIKNKEDAFRVIRQMNVRGAPLIAIVALLGLCVDLKHKYDENTDGTLVDYVRKSCEYLKTSRPTAVNLLNSILSLTQFIDNLSESGDINFIKG